MSDMVLSVYQKQVQDLAAGKVNFRITNRQLAHAAVLMESIFNNASNEVRLYSGDLNQAFYSQNSLRTAFRHFLQKPDAKLFILTDEPLHPQHVVVALLAVYGAGSKVQFRARKKNKPPSEDVQHFAVMDRVGFRYEFSHDARDPMVVEAVANFNEPDTASRLADKFDSMFSTGTSFLIS